MASSRPMKWTFGAAWKCNVTILTRTCTTGTSVDNRGDLFPEDIDHDDRWRFSNVLVN